MGWVAMRAAASTSLAAALNSPSAVDDLGAAFAFGFSLLGHGAEHVLRHIDLLDLNRDDLQAEGRGVAVDDGLDALVEAVAVCQKLVKIDLAQHGPERRLGKLGGLVDVIGDVDDGVNGIDDAERDDRVDLQGDVVARDDVLRRNLHGLLAQAHADNRLHGGKDEDESGAGGLLADAPKLEDDGTLILLEDFDGVEQVQDDDDGNDEEREGKRHGMVFLGGRRASAMPYGGSVDQTGRECRGEWRQDLYDKKREGGTLSVPPSLFTADSLEPDKEAGEGLNGVRVVGVAQEVLEEVRLQIEGLTETGAKAEVGRHQLFSADGVVVRLDAFMRESLSSAGCGAEVHGADADGGEGLHAVERMGRGVPGNRR